MIFHVHSDITMEVDEGGTEPGNSVNVWIIEK